MKTSELTGPALDWAVAQSLGYTTSTLDLLYDIKSYDRFKPSTDWSQGGPIIEDDELGVAKYGPNGAWKAVIGETPRGAPQYGPTPLIAAMRCFVASKLGDDIDIPEELL